jgi:hypothetical protein
MKKSKFASIAIRALAVSLPLIVVFGAGLVVGTYKPPVYFGIRYIFKNIRMAFPADPRYLTVSPEWLRTNVEEQIQIATPEDVPLKRNALIDFIWKGKGFPLRDSFDSEQTDNGKEYSDVALKTLRYTIVEDYGVTAFVYHMFANSPRNELVIVNSGHSGNLEKHAIRFFLSKGYDVLALSMPLLPPNNRPFVEIPRLGRIRLSMHEQLPFLDSDEFSSIKYFVDPIAVSINYVKHRFAYSTISFVGVSGGGWTASLYAALDPRVTNSYPVAAGYPLFLRDDDLGDYEQTLPAMYRIVNYLELYVLGSYGDGRRQLQIFNQYDPCCFGGVRYKVYEDALKSRLRKLNQGGHYDIYVDRTNFDHTASDETLAEIARDIERNKEIN